MRVQGIVFPDEHRLHSMPNSLVQDLAGNAFETRCCTAVLLVGLSCLCLASDTVRHPAACEASQTGSVPRGPKGEHPLIPFAVSDPDTD